jgi:GH15 family glucan-1,4-alpha-glucosidase
MPLDIEDYALIGDTQTAALVGKDGSIDWLCVPRFDSNACFAALLGSPKHGRWQISPSGPVRSVRRRYRPDTLVLETEFTTEDGIVRVVDCMPPRERTPDIVRLVEGVDGKVSMRMELIIRFGYGSVVPWVRRIEDCLVAMAGPDALCLRASVETEGRDLTTVAEFNVEKGKQIPFVLSWFPSHEKVPSAMDAARAVLDTESWWHGWLKDCNYQGPWRAEVVRSLITLKALTYQPTGGIVAAPTTSLPEKLGGERNWDYRYCWLRDATFTLYSLMLAGLVEEANAWRDWLLRAVAGDPTVLQILYGASGERHIEEFVVDWLPGYKNASPVRIGNAAVHQFQLDVYGELLDSMHQARCDGLARKEYFWPLEKALTEFVASHWSDPDEGIWEVRGPRRHFTHSKVMAWVALDRAVKGIERFGLPGPLDRWRQLRSQIHSEVCRKGYDSERKSFTQYFGSKDLDASLLMIPLVGFLPPQDERVRGTVAAIEHDLWRNGFVIRYPTKTHVDGLPPGEGAFLPCTFWLADNLVLLGRRDDARAIFERLLGLANDVGLLSEEYDPEAKRLVGNFPQAFSHVALVNSAHNLTRADGPAARRQTK